MSKTTKAILANQILILEALEKLPEEISEIVTKVKKVRNPNIVLLDDPSHLSNVRSMQRELEKTLTRYQKAETRAKIEAQIAELERKLETLK